MVEDQQGDEVEVEEGGEEELSQATQLEESRQIMEPLADRQKPKQTEHPSKIYSMPSQLSLFPVLC